MFVFVVVFSSAICCLYDGEALDREFLIIHYFLLRCRPAVYEHIFISTFKISIGGFSFMRETSDSSILVLFRVDGKRWIFLYICHFLHGVDVVQTCE